MANAKQAAEERVDVVDDAGETIAVVTRREMRERRLPHRCCYVLVFNRRGELLIHLRTATKDVYPSHWDICVGGVLAAGESFGDGVDRDVREDIGADLAVVPLYPFRYEDPLTIVHGMLYRAVSDGPFQFQVEEIVRGEFVAVEEALRRSRSEPFCPDGVLVLTEYLCLTRE